MSMRSDALRAALFKMVLCAAIAAVAAGAAPPLRAADFGADLPTVDRIEILGNRSFDDGTLKKRMRTKEARFYHILRKPKFRRDFLRRDVEAVVSFYHLNGFFDAAVTIESHPGAVRELPRGARFIHAVFII